MTMAFISGTLLSQMFRVFVYGTLKRGEPNFHVMSETAGVHQFVDTGLTVDLFPLLITSKFNIPAVLAKKGLGHRIHGEVYDVDEKKLAVLDELEAYPTLYDRKQEKIELGNGTTTETWIYVLREWREDIYEVSTPLMSNYSSKGEHGRPYVERYARALAMKSDEHYDLYADIQGKRNAKTRLLTLEKAENDTRK